MGYTEHIGSGTVPKSSDTERILLVKILNATTSGGGGGSGSVLAADYGGIAPAVSPSGPAIALDTSGADGTHKIWYYNGTTWTDTGIQI